jgi:two-component system response regulator RegA
MKTARKLLIVDDDDAFRESMALEFEDRGWVALQAANAQDAHSAALIHRPGFALVDMRLGTDRGLVVLKDLMDHLPTCRAIMLTGYASLATAVEAMTLGAHHYLTKPCDPDLLVMAFEAPRGDPNVAVPEKPPSLALHEREYIEYVLAATGGNISEAARRLGLHRQSLQRKLRKYPPRH